jgi:hypothetical protein
VDFDYKFWLTAILSAWGLYYNRKQLQAAKMTHTTKYSSRSKSARDWIAYWPTALTVTLIGSVWFVYASESRYQGTPQTDVRLGQFNFTQFRGGTSIEKPEAGKKIAMNVGIRNYGPLPALDAGATCQIKLLPELTSSTENDRWNDFVKTVPITGTTDLEVDGESWYTYYSDPLSASDIADMATDRLRVYAFVRFEYRDRGGKHATTSCQWLQNPVAAGPVPGTIIPVWHKCQNKEHNQIR